MFLFFGFAGIALHTIAAFLDQYYKKFLSMGTLGKGILVKHIKPHSWSRTMNPVIRVSQGGQDRYFISPVGSKPPSGKPGDVVEILFSKEDSNRATVTFRFLEKITGALKFVSIVNIALAGYFFLKESRGGDALITSSLFVVFLLIPLAIFFQKLKNQNKPGQKGFKDLLKTENIFQEFLTDEEVDQVMSDTYEAKQKVWKTPGESAESPKETYIKLSRKKENPLTTKALLGLLAIIGGGTIYFGILKGNEMYALKQNGLRAPGVIVGKQVNRGSGTTYTPIIEYTPQNSTIKYKVKGGFSSSHPSWRVGDKVTVVYDPQFPSQGVWDDGIWNYFTSIFLILFGVFFCVPGIAASLAQNKKQIPYARRKPGELPKRPPNRRIS